MPMKNSIDIGNRTRNIPACSAVPQPAAPPCAPKHVEKLNKINIQDVSVRKVKHLYRKLVYYHKRVMVEGQAAVVVVMIVTKNCLGQFLVYTAAND
jgi:hypothetical protein